MDGDPGIPGLLPDLGRLPAGTPGGLQKGRVGDEGALVDEVALDGNQLEGAEAAGGSGPEVVPPPPVLAVDIGDPASVHPVGGDVHRLDCSRRSDGPRSHGRGHREREETRKDENFVGTPEQGLYYGI